MENVKENSSMMKDDSSSVSDQKSLNPLSEIDPTQNGATESAVLMSDFKWCDSATALMLKLYKEKQMKFNNPHVKKKVVWREIADIMQQNGYAFDADRCERKFLNLKTSYRNTIQHNCMTGNMSRTCAFFAELHEIFQMQIGLDDGKSSVNLQPSPVRLVANANNVQVIPVSDSKESRSTITSPGDNSAYRYSSQRQQPSHVSSQPQTSSETHSTVPYSIPNSSPNSQFHVSASMFLEASAQRNNTSGSRLHSHGQTLQQKITDSHNERRQVGSQSLNNLSQRNPGFISNSSSAAQSPHQIENGRHYQTTSVIDLCNDRKRSNSTEDDVRQDRIKKRKNSSDLQSLLNSFEKYREEQKVREDDRMKLMKEFHDEEMKVMNRFLDIIQQCVQNSDD